MRKKILLICLPFFILTACQNKEEIEKSSINSLISNQVKKVGILLPLGGAMNSFGASNLLKLENGKTVFLKSKNFDLNSSNYLNERVEIWGKLTKNDQNIELLEVNSIDKTESANVSEVVVPEWKLLVLDKMGISLKYRNDYLYTEFGNNLKFLAPVVAVQKIASEINIKLVASDPNYNLKEQLGLTSDSPDDLKSKGLSRSKITTSGLDAYKKVSLNGKQIDFYLFHNNKAWSISFLGGDGNEVTKEQNLFFDLLASINLN